MGFGHFEVWGAGVFGDLVYGVHGFEGFGVKWGLGSAVEV